MLVNACLPGNVEVLANGWCATVGRQDRVSRRPCTQPDAGVSPTLRTSKAVPRHGNCAARLAYDRFWTASNTPAPRRVTVAPLTALPRHAACLPGPGCRERRRSQAPSCPGRYGPRRRPRKDRCQPRELAEKRNSSPHRAFSLRNQHIGGAYDVDFGVRNMRAGPT